RAATPTKATPNGTTRPICTAGDARPGVNIHITSPAPGAATTAAAMRIEAGLIPRGARTSRGLYASARLAQPRAGAPQCAVPSRATGGDQVGTGTRALSTCGWTAGFVLAFYVVLYPIHGYRVPIGSDTPVYVWWARLSGALGIGGFGTRSRALVAGLIAVLSKVTGTNAAAVAESLGPALAASVALGTGALLHATL